MDLLYSRLLLESTHKGKNCRKIKRARNKVPSLNLLHQALMISTARISFSCADFKSAAILFLTSGRLTSYPVFV
jgi:hypothetical protein